MGDVFGVPLWAAAVLAAVAAGRLTAWLLAGSLLETDLTEADMSADEMPAPVANAVGAVSNFALCYLLWPALLAWCLLGLLARVLGVHIKRKG